MAARYYFQILEADPPDQDEDDDLTFPSDDASWREVLGGTFRISWIAPVDSDSVGSSGYTLLHVDTVTGGANGLEFVVDDLDGGVRVLVFLDGDELVRSDIFTFSAGQELTFTFSAIDGSATVSGATTGDGTTTGTGWNCEAGDVYLGRNFNVGNYAGYVSLPYAVPDAPAPQDAP